MCRSGDLLVCVGGWCSNNNNRNHNNSSVPTSSWQEDRRKGRVNKDTTKHRLLCKSSILLLHFQLSIHSIRELLLVKGNECVHASLNIIIGTL